MPLSTTPAGQVPSTSKALREMFSARKRVFVDLLRWDVPVIDDCFEVDQFDTPDASYLILAGPSGNHIASARILHTDRSHILKDLFAFLCAGTVPTGHSCREITRFCIDPRLTRNDRRLARNRLVSALADYAVARGISTYTAVANPAWYAQIVKFGWKCSSLGPASRWNGEDLIALRIDIDARTIGDLEEGGIYAPTAYQTLTIAPEYIS